jgi:hypothetical protein
VRASAGRRHGWALAALGGAALLTALLARPADARSAAAQDWAPFVLVTGLLLIGVVAAADGLFDAAGSQLARIAPSGRLTFVGAAAITGAVTALLNLDTSVAFLTPVFVATARSRGSGEAPLLYGCLLLSNAGSLFLPGSNLTNLIVLGSRHLSGASFLAHMWAPALVALVVTALVVAYLERAGLRAPRGHPPPPQRPTLGLGLLGVVAATVVVVTTASPALPVAAVGVAAVAIRLVTGKDRPRHVVEALGVPVLGQPHVHDIGQLRLDGSHSRGRRSLIVLLHWWWSPSRLEFLANTRDLSEDRSRAGDRHLKFHAYRDNLQFPAPVKPFEIKLFRGPSLHSPFLAEPGRFGIRPMEATMELRTNTKHGSKCPRNPDPGERACNDISGFRTTPRCITSDVRIIDIRSRCRR